jgi:flagellar motor switch protein FliG
MYVRGSTMDFDKYLVDTPKYFRITQRVTRELDGQVLALALAALPQRVRDYVLKNVSRGAAEILGNDIARMETSASAEQKQAAAETVYAMYERIAEEYTELEVPPEPTSRSVPFPDEVVIRLDTKEEVIKSIVKIAEVARAQGLLALEEIHSSDNTFFQLGFQMVIDGTDPEIVHSILERTKTTALHQLDEKLSMMMEGLESIQAGDNPRLIEARLKAYLAS